MLRIGIILISLLSFSLPAFAEGMTPMTLKGAVTVDSDQVKLWLDDGEDMVIIDARKKSDFSDQRIPNSENCPVNTETDIKAKSIKRAVKWMKACSAVKGLSKSTKIVVYCNSVKCWQSPKAALALSQMGYSNLQWYRGGINAWKKAGFPLE